MKILLLAAAVAVVAAAALAAVSDALRGDVRSGARSCSFLRTKRFGGDLAAITGSDSTCKHVVGVSKRRSHG